MGTDVEEDEIWVDDEATDACAQLIVDGLFPRVAERVRKFLNDSIHAGVETYVQDAMAHFLSGTGTSLQVLILDQADIEQKEIPLIEMFWTDLSHRLVSTITDLPKSNWLTYSPAQNDPDRARIELLQKMIAVYEAANPDEERPDV